MTLLQINRLLPIYISIVPLKFEVDIQSQTKVRVRKPKKSNMAARRPFWKWQRWKSIGFCLWPPSTCIWNLKLKLQSKLDLCSGNHVVYRQTDGRTRWIQYTPPPTSLGGGITIGHLFYATSSFVHHFIAIGDFKLELQSGNAQFGSNSTISRAVWPWNLTDDLEKQ